MLLVLQLAVATLVGTPPSDPGPGVSQELARHRARTLADVR